MDDQVIIPSDGLSFEARSYYTGEAGRARCTMTSFLADAEPELGNTLFQHSHLREPASRLATDGTSSQGSRIPD